MKISRGASSRTASITAILERKQPSAPTRSAAPETPSVRTDSEGGDLASSPSSTHPSARDREVSLVWCQFRFPELFVLKQDEK